MTKRSIAREIKQGQPFRSGSQEAVISLMRTAHVLRRRFESIVSAEGITTQQYNVLRILRGAKTPLPTMEISDRMIETACGITRLLTTLEEKELIRREQWTGDRRHFLCQITPAGLRTLDRLDAPINALDHLIDGCLSKSRIAELIDSLAEIRDQIASDEPESATSEVPVSRRRSHR